MINYFAGLSGGTEVVMVDFHSHILPGIDDGAKDVDMSVKMLETSFKQGIKTILATPHYYKAHNGIDEFIKKRNDSFNILKNKINDNMIEAPDIKCGAEVLLCHEIMKEDVEKLCIEGTNTILVELPFTIWGDWLYEDIYLLIVKHKLNVVIAHFDRYVKNKKDFKNIEPIINLDVNIQLNADTIITRRDRKIVDIFFNEYRVNHIGSDMHNLTTRISNMDKAVSLIEKRYGKDALDKIISDSNKIFKG